MSLFYIILLCLNLGIVEEGFQAEVCLYDPDQGPLPRTWQQHWPQVHCLCSTARAPTSQSPSCQGYEDILGENLRDIRVYNHLYDMILGISCDRGKRGDYITNISQQNGGYKTNHHE